MKFCMIKNCRVTGARVYRVLVDGLPAMGKLDGGEWSPVDGIPIGAERHAKALAKAGFKEIKGQRAENFIRGANCANVGWRK